jgi:predicted pyridoxine 5'-phosphate oxidase superfamily flavin-nucleotide-binding protein
MQFTEIKDYIDRSVLCWLATSSAENIPNVSPKEIFCAYDEDCILVANIASPQTVRNIRENNRVCISFIDILLQKGVQIKGTAQIVGKNDPAFQELELPLLQLTDGKFPFSSITKISVHSAKPIIAPRYIFYPETTELEQIESARKTYGV